MKQTPKSVAMAALAALCSLTADITRAADGNEGRWYGGLSIGRSHNSLNNSDVDGALAVQGITSTSAFVKRDITWGLHAGYQFTANFALEGAVTRLGKFGFGAVTAAPGVDAITGQYKADALSLAAVGLLPLGHQWTLYGKAGLAHTSVKLDAASNAGVVIPVSTSSSGTGLVLGLGATYDLSKKAYVKVGWDRYVGVGNDTTGRANIDVGNVGFGLRF